MPEKPETLKCETIYAGRKVALEVHDIRGADGRRAEREVIRHPGSVAILATPQAGRILLERIWRYAVGREMIEIPAGTLEPGEDPEACAARELAEETGYRAGRLRAILRLHPSPGILSEMMTVYRAYDLREGEPAREAGEEIETVLVPVAEVLAMIADGRITDAKTVASVLWAKQSGELESAVNAQ
jgi:8-oxo-dGTP pyrophosphatase MutT (NUDIX family)